jgi:hypothetical protein
MLPSQNNPFKGHSFPLCFSSFLLPVFVFSFWFSSYMCLASSIPSKLHFSALVNALTKQPLQEMLVPIGLLSRDPWLFLSIPYLGMFRIQLWNATAGFFMSVSTSEWLPPGNYHEISFMGIHGNLWNILIWLKLDKNIRTFTLRCM